MGQTAQLGLGSPHSDSVSLAVSFFLPYKAQGSSNGTLCEDTSLIVKTLVARARGDDIGNSTPGKG